jgi:TRAP-type C4-dicarboxylate transport system permease small subunit
MHQRRNACLWNEDRTPELPGWGCKPFAIFWALCILLVATIVGIAGGKGAVLGASPTLAIWIMSLGIFWVYCQDCAGWKGLWIANFTAMAVSIAMFFLLLSIGFRQIKPKESDKPKEAEKEQEKK